MQALKYPDMDVVRFYYKSGVSKKNGSVIEFGAGCGNNLKLFFLDGWKITGLDFDKDNIDQMKKFLAGEFIHSEMYEWFKINKDLTAYDVVMFPSSLYYMTEEQINYILTNIKFKNGVIIFIKMRGYTDYRAKLIKSKSGIIFFPETGEQGCINTFYSPYEIRTLLEKRYDVENEVILKSQWENLMSGEVIFNDEWIYWGKLCEKI